MTFAVILSQFVFKIITFCFGAAICDLVHDVYIIFKPALPANCILQSFRNMSESGKLQFFVFGNQSYFKKYVQMPLVVHIDHVYV